MTNIRTGSRRAFGGVLLVGVGLLGAACTVTTANPASSASPTTPATSPPVTAPPITSAPGSSASDALHAWWQSGVSTDYQSLSNDYSAMKADANYVSSVEADCRNLTSDAQKLQTDAPVPDSTLNPLWQTALMEYAKGGIECSTAEVGQDPQEMEAAVGDLTTANSTVSQFTGQLKQDMGE